MKSDRNTMVRREPGIGGRLKRRLLTPWLRTASVVAIEHLSPSFRLIDLEGDDLRGIRWTAGDKIQLLLGTDLHARTYTPIHWDAERGRTRLLAYAHGDGPGSQWIRSVAMHDTIALFGPRRSLELASIPRLALLFGDETAFGLAVALKDRFDSAATLQFEVTSAAESRAVLDAVGLDRARIVERLSGDAHLTSVESAIVHQADANQSSVLAGKATSIRRLGRAMKAHGVLASRIKAKPYWSPGRSGLD